MIEYWAYKLAACFSRYFPEKLAYWVGLRVSDQFYKRNHNGRRAVMSNLKQIAEFRGIVLAEDAVEGLSRKMFQYFGKYLVDFFRYATITPDEIKRRISFQNKQYLEDCVKLGRGALLVTAHVGNWELGGAVMSALGYKMNALVLPQRLEKLNRLFQSQREKRGMNLIPVGNSAFSVIRCLKNKELVALLGDRDFTTRDERISFFGRPAKIPKGPAWLSIRTGAPILPAFLLRQVDDTFLMRMYPPIMPEQEKTVEAVQARICRVLEQVIGEQPYQWFMFDDFWAEGGSDKAKAGQA